MKFYSYKNKKLFFYISVITLFLSWCFLSIKTATAKPIEIRFSHVVPKNTPKGLMATRFKDLVRERLGDEKVIVKVFPNQELYEDNKVLEAILLGDVEIAAPTLSKFKKYTKKLQLFDLPFLFKDANAAANFLKSPHGLKLLRSLDSEGFKGLGFLDNGMKQLSATKKIYIPSDVTGLKFRIMRSDVLEAQFDALSAIPLKKLYSDVYDLLASGAVDGQENTWSNMYAKEFYRFQPYIMNSNHGYLGYMVVTSEEFWNSLPDDIRKIVKQALNEAIEYGNQIAKKKAISDRNAIIDSGLTEIYQITDQQRQLWIDIMKPVWKKFEDQIGAEMIAAAAKQN